MTVNSSTVITWQNKAWALVACAETATTTTLRIKWMIRNAVSITAYRDALEQGVPQKRWTESARKGFAGIVRERYQSVFKDDDANIGTFTAEQVARLPKRDRAIPAMLALLAGVQQNGAVQYALAEQLLPLLRPREQGVVLALYNERERADTIAAYKAKAAEVEQAKANGHLSNSQLKRLARKHPAIHAAALAAQERQGIQYAEAIRLAVRG